MFVARAEHVPPFDSVRSTRQLDRQGSEDERRAGIDMHQSMKLRPTKSKGTPTKCGTFPGLCLDAAAPGSTALPRMTGMG